MIDPLQAAIRIAGAGLDAQSTRMRVVSENIANANATGSTPGTDPYARKTISFQNEMDRVAGVPLVQVRSIDVDLKPFRLEFNPGHPAADDKGQVKLPNVDIMVELADLREANRSYQANLQAVRQSRELVTMTLDLLKA
jgi:flagellar basal-body rod protein FlgC